MPVTVNGVELTDDDIEREMDQHRDARNPARMATVSAILRRLMRTEAERLGIARGDMDDDALETWLDRIDPVRPDRTLDLRRLAGCPKAIVRRALHRWLQAQPKAGELSRQGFGSLLAAVEQARPSRHSLGVRGFAVIRRDRLQFVSGPRRS